MDLSEYIAVQQDFQSKANYYNEISFPTIAQTFSDGADAMGKAVLTMQVMLEQIEKLNKQIEDMTNAVTDVEGATVAHESEEATPAVDSEEKEGNV